MVGPLRDLDACILEGLAGANPCGVFLWRPARRLIRNEHVIMLGCQGFLAVRRAVLGTSLESLVGDPLWLHLPIRPCVAIGPHLLAACCLEVLMDY